MPGPGGPARESAVTAPVCDRAAMIAGMKPVPDPQVYEFCTFADHDADAATRAAALASFAEDEGLSLILPQDAARRAGIAPGLAMRRITLSVHSALDGVGLTAAVASALADHGIACNMVAAYHHDHVFVPADDAARALDLLHGLARRMAG
jgi:hypothetical protein